MSVDGIENLTVLAAGGSIVLALKERLRRNDPNDKDKENIELSKLIMERRQQGRSWREISEETGVPEPSVCGYAKRGVHRAIVEWLNTPTPTPAKTAGDIFSETGAAAADAMQFIKDALAKNEDGTWKNEAMAMWATERLAARGLIDLGEVKPTIEIKLHTVKEIMDPADADEREAKFRATHQGAAQRKALSTGEGEDESSAPPQPENMAVQ